MFFWSFWSFFWIPDDSEARFIRANVDCSFITTATAAQKWENSLQNLVFQRRIRLVHLFIDSFFSIHWLCIKKSVEIFNVFWLVSVDFSHEDKFLTITIVVSHLLHFNFYNQRSARTKVFHLRGTYEYESTWVARKGRDPPEVITYSRAREISKSDFAPWNSFHPRGSTYDQIWRLSSCLTFNCTNHSTCMLIHSKKSAHPATILYSFLTCNQSMFLVSLWVSRRH